MCSDLAEKKVPEADVKLQSTQGVEEVMRKREG